MKQKYSEEAKYKNVQSLREQYIRKLAKSETPSLLAKEMADDLFALDLTVYSKNYSFDSILYSAFAASAIDTSIALHPEQMQIIHKIEEENALIISAPTSFGKTFCIFEYVARYQPQNVVLIVPTLALVDEYFRKIIRKYRDSFREYKVHTNVIEENVSYQDSKNIFVLTHDRIVSEDMCNKLPRIDFLVIDEVYKLETDTSDDRVLVLNMAYYRLAMKSVKYVLLAPFIGKIEDVEQLSLHPAFWRTEYSPVINDVRPVEILSEEERFPMVKRILDNDCQSQKTLIYFPTVASLYSYVSGPLKKEPVLEELPQNIQFFIEWAKEEIHDEWCLVTALERGYLIHNGQIPLGTRSFQLDCYDSTGQFNKMLCTSTLLEGVNTTAENIIITRPSRKSNKPGESCFEAFDFYNLVGRTGRLTQNFIGNAYYIKGPSDPDFSKEAAVKSIRFELTDDSKDIDIQKGNFQKHPDVMEFLRQLNISQAEYLENIGTKVRYESVVALHHRYLENKEVLIGELGKFLVNSKQGRRDLVNILFKICGGFSHDDKTSDSRAVVSLLTSLLRQTRPTIKAVVNSARVYYPRDINYLISMAIRIKESYMEHTFYNRVSIVAYFLKKDGVSDELLDVLDDRIIKTIEMLYFTGSKHKKMLLDLGIYEKDINAVLKIIGDDFEDAVELRERLIKNQKRFGKLSFLSRYVIERIV